DPPRDSDEFRYTKKSSPPRTGDRGERPLFSFPLAPFFVRHHSLDGPAGMAYPGKGPRHARTRARSQPPMSEFNHPPSPDPSRPVERRAWVRYPCAGDTSCLPIVAAPDSQWPGQVVDLSAGGVGVLLPRRFETG